MRRSLAIFLALVFSALLTLPAFANSTQSSLPACCRKAGKHHCLARTIGVPGSGVSFATVNEKCSTVLRSTVAEHKDSFTPAIDRVISVGFLLHSSLTPHTETGFSAPLGRSSPKRGPPSFRLA